jgi:hypothetical protein
MRKFTGIGLLAAMLALAASMAGAQQRIAVVYNAVIDNAGPAPAPLDGRVFLYIAKPGAEAAVAPRFLISDQPGTEQFFGVDVTAWRPGTPATFDAQVLGYPLASLAGVPAGDYIVQALFNRYTVFHRADGHTVLLPAEAGEGQDMQRKPGNLYSVPRRVHLDPHAPGTLRLTLTQAIPPLAPPPDTAWIRHLTIPSALLTRFWGRPMYVSATVVLPPGFAQHPRAHYPVMIQQNHFTRRLAPQFDRVRALWTAGKLPHFLWVDINHANPYYDDSYAVNSANLGPYGDAIMQELIPAVEQRFRGIGQGWARFTYGCSTGGWEALADQILYPGEFNGAWGASPDPVDFRAFQIVNIYQDANAFWLQGPWSRLPRPDERRPDGGVTQTMARDVQRELVLGTHGRSADQWDAWQAVFGPVGPDGYPAPIWDPMTGVIDRQVAAYWKSHFDLDAWLNAHWRTLAPKLDGKLHVYVGEMDSYYLNNAVYLMQAMINRHDDPKITASFTFGPRQPHCFDGTYGKQSEEQLYMPQMLQRLRATAPAGADMSWDY